MKLMKLMESTHRFCINEAPYVIVRMGNETPLVYIDNYEATIWCYSDEVSLKLKSSHKTMIISSYDLYNAIGMDIPSHIQGTSCVHLFSRSAQYLLLQNVNEFVSSQESQNASEDIDIVSSFGTETGISCTTVWTVACHSQDKLYRQKLTDAVISKEYLFQILKMTTHAQGKLNRKMRADISRLYSEADEIILSSSSLLPPQNKKTVEERYMQIMFGESSDSQSNSYQERDEEGQQEKDEEEQQEKDEEEQQEKDEEEQQEKDEEEQQDNLQDMFQAPQSWAIAIQQYSGDLTSLSTYIRSLPPEVLTKRDAKSRTIFHALIDSQLSFAEVKRIVLCYQDAHGNTLFHLAMETQDHNSIVFILEFVQPESLGIRNEDGLTLLELAFEKKLWKPAHALAEHHIKTGAGHVFLQDYFFKAMRRQGGVDFLPHLLDLRERYFPDLDLNFSIDGKGRTPWWYLANSNDITVMQRALQPLEEHSIDLKKLLTHTKRQTKLTEEAAVKKRLLFEEILKVGGAAGSNWTVSGGEILLQAHSRPSVFTSSPFENKREPVMPNTVPVEETQSHKVSMTPSTLVSSCEEQQQVNSQDIFSSLHSWDAEIQRHSSDFASLSRFIQSLSPEMLTKKDAQSRTICHALGAVCGQLSSGDINHLPELISRVCLPECMIWQDASGNTPLHCIIEAQNTQNVDAILRFVPNLPECLVLKNEDNLTPLDLAFEKKLWVPAHALAKCQIKAGAGCALLQDYFLRAMREQGGVDFLPHLLDLRERYFPNLNLNFNCDTGGRTPWWYLVNSNDISVMFRVLQTLKDYSIDLMQLLTHTERQTRLVEEAADKNRLLFTTIQKVVGWGHSSGDKDMADEDETNLCSTGPRVLSQASSFSRPKNQLSIQHEFGMSKKASMMSQRSHKSPTLESSSAEQKYMVSKLKTSTETETKDSSGHSTDTLCVPCSTGCLSLVSSSIPDSRSTELHHAVRNQCLQSVRDILTCGGEEELTDSSHLLVYTMFRREITKKNSDLEVAVQEQGIPSESEIVSVVHMGNFIIAYRSDVNSLVVDLVRTNRGSHEFHTTRTTPSVQPAQTPDRMRSEFEFHQTRATVGIPPHQSAQPSDASTTGRMPNATEHTLRPPTVRRTLPRVVEDSPYSQPKSSATELSTQRQSSHAPLRSLGLDSRKEVTTWQTWIDKAVDCLHAGYYSQMLEVLKFGKVAPPLPAEIAMAAQFGCALGYYKLEKYSEAAKHLASLKAIAESAQSHGNESIASVYLGDIEFTQSRYTEAAKHYSHALKLYKSDNLGKEYRLIVPTFSAISAKLGTAFMNTSKVVDAVQAYRQAIATADSKKDKLSAHTSLGNLFQSVGENASALAEYEHSIKLSEELQDYVSLGWAHGNMGNTYLGLYQRDKGLYHLEKALDLTVEHEPTPQAIGRAYNNLGTAFQALNELDKAEEKYDLALSHAIYGNDLPGQARVYGNIGNVLMLRKDYDRAIPHYTEVLHLSRDRSTVSTAFHNRGCSYYEWAESKKATLPQKAGFTLHGSDFENYEVEHQPSFKSLPNSILKYYQLGRQDLEQVIKYHEETFENIKGSSKGLTLSVSLFETNSRTFHRLQDCLVNLGEWEKALVVAEQSRTRTLGELLVKRKNSKIDHPLTAPLNLQSITDIVQSQHSVVVYLSYTGARLLGWVLAPTPDKVSMDMFEVPLEDDQFDGKSFDYHLRYSLTEELVERSFEMYRAVDYKSDGSEPVRKLYKLVCKPLMKVLKELKDPDSASGVQEMIIIPDSYTCLLPFPCLLDEEDKFLGDSYSFRIMPSLLTMGIVDQLPSVVVQVPADGRSMCVVGNPTIPSFVYNGDQWSLGKLSFATREAEWVANILKTAPILHEQATKDAVLMRIMNAKVIHIATHGSVSAGFLAFAGVSSARNGETVEAKNVLLHPEDIERLSISPALVVLSSCDSGRGTVKADGILGMARAFILAGAQAVLTTLWRVPDESGSVFMQFFYQYLMDGLKASLALQKATLSVRCFSKYSQYIHWSGYQLTGREIQFDITKPSKAAALEARLGKSSVFPRLEVVQQLESAFLKDPHTPSDVQILRGSPGVKPSEPLVDFIHSFHDAFKGGIFWINGRRQELVDASAAYIKQATGTVPTASQTHPVLLVFDHIDQMPQISTSLMDLLKHPNTHIVVISKNYALPDVLLREIDHQLLRGCNIIDVKPLSPIHTTQRIVHSILSAHHLPPTNEDQNIFEKLARFTSGFPALTDVTAALLLSQMEQDSQNEVQDTHDTLVNFNNQLSLDEMDPSIRDPEQDPWCTTSHYSWQAVTTLIDQCSLSAEERLLLFAVSMFSCSPVPMSVVTEVSSMIAKATQKPHISTSLHSKLFQMQLMKRYPLPVILHPSLGVHQLSAKPEIIYVPQYIARAIWKDMMSDRDKGVALTTMYMALCTLADNLGSSDIGFLSGLSSLLVELYELNYELMGKQCYKEVYKLYLHIDTATKLPEKLSVMGSIPRDRMFIGRMQCFPSAATPHHPTLAPDTGDTPLHPTPAPDTGDTPLHLTPAPDTGATHLHTMPEPYELNYELTGKQCYQEVDRLYLYNERDPDRKLAALHNKGITSSHLASLGASENSTEQGEESCGQSSDKESDEERTLDIQENVDNQSPEAEVGSSTLLSTELSEDSPCESSSGTDTSPPEADDELSSSGSCSHSTLGRHKRTMPARKRGVTTKEKKSSSLTLDDLEDVTEPLLEMERTQIYHLGVVLGLRQNTLPSDTGATPPHPTPPPDTGATPPHPTPPPDTGATPPHPTPPPDTGATPPHPTPPPDTGATPPHPTPSSNTGATPPHTTPLHRMVSGQQNSKMMGHWGECKPIPASPKMCQKRNPQEHWKLIHCHQLLSAKKHSRCVVLIGKSGVGKSTIANQLVKHEPPPIKLPFEDASGPVTAMHEVKQEIVEFQWENDLYRLMVIDTVGFLPTKEAIDYAFDKIEKYIITNIEKLNLFLFVIKKGCFTVEDQEMFTSIFSLIRKRLCNDFSPISALAITGCEDDTSGTRRSRIREFKCNRTTQDIASQMGMGIYAVGFPDVKVMHPVLQQHYKKNMLQDRDTLRTLIVQAKPEKDVKIMMAQLTIAETRLCDMKPTMAQLTRLNTAKGDLEIIETIAPDWKAVGCLMDFDPFGKKLDLIEAEHAHKRNGVLTCCQEIFKLWLRRENATWKKLIELIPSQHKVLAKQVMDAVGLS